MPTLDELKEIIEHLQQDIGKEQKIMLQFDGVVNELNNLLAVMQGNAQLADRDRTDEARNELVRVVLAGTTRARQIIEDHLSARATAEPRIPAAEAGASPAPADILIVDDDKSICSMVARILAQDGHAVTQAFNGQDAIEFCQKHKFDIVFLDVRLSDMNGIEVCRKIRALSAKSCVIFFSGDLSIEDPTQLIRQEGAVGFIRKPFDIHEIKNVVQHILGQRTRPSTAAT